MRTTRLEWACILAVVATACAPQNEGGMPVAADSNAPLAHAAGSWIQPEAQSQELLYVSRAEPNDPVVQMYSYRTHRLLGKISGFFDPVSLCVDRAQNVYVVDYSRYQIAEYAHGSTTPINLFADPKGSPLGCAVDPRTGSLAVTNLVGRPGLGSVLVYKDARSVPRVYQVPGIAYFWFPTYDLDGNLFVDGSPYNQGSVKVSELPRDSTDFHSIELNQTIGYPGCIQWADGYLTVGDQSNNAIYRFAISGSTGTLAGTTLLRGAIDVFQYAIVKQEFRTVQDIVLGADHGSDGYPGNVLAWYYPAGGTPLFTMSGMTAISQMTFASGVALSRAIR